MKIFISIKRSVLLLVASALFFTACNKLELDPTPADQPTPATSPTLASLLDDPGFTLLKAAATKGGLMPLLSNTSLRHTFFAPDNAAIIASLGVPDEATAAAYIASRPDAEIAGLISYHLIPQVIRSSSISTAFPNFEYPTIINPAPAVSALLRLTTFPSVRPGIGAWVNNIPIIAPNIEAVNGVLHKVARIVVPPTIDLWAKIQTDADLTYLKAAIARADSGVAVGGRLEDALSTTANPAAIASNLTVFAPTDAAMKIFLTGAITQALIAKGIPPANAQLAAAGIVAATGTTLLSNPALIPDIPGIPVVGLGPQLAAVITPQLAKAVVAYHVVASQSAPYGPPGIRVFSVNTPTTATQLKTLLMPAAPLLVAEPLVTVQATFIAGQPIVGAMTVKGVGNTTASNVIINAPPVFTHDLHYVNGVIHKIDQTLVPPPAR